MNHDSFYTKIEQRLAGQLNGQKFEECAVALLREVYPGLVPVRGGSDAGMDGAIADGKGRPLPLVCTTSERGTTNLHRNLQSYIEKGGLRRQAVFATSRVLTKRRRDSLDKAAAEHGFTLWNIHDGADFADRLWGNPRWCRELLGLTGDPCPLSVVPRSTRPLLNTAIVGREEDVAWLREPVGDRLLVGQPGSGKTFLLRHLTREGRALFVNSRDRGEIAAGIREQDPSVLIVDDAAPSDSVIVDLLQLREGVGAEFTIIASCWPQHQDRLEEILGATKNSVRTLALLAQEEIAQVVEGTGLKPSVPLMNELVAQAEGRPGLATTLAHMLLQGGWEEVVSGKRLRESLLGPLAAEVIPVLGTFALGGTRGLTQQGVESALGTSRMALWCILRDCEAAGVLYDAGADRISIRPPVLRYALVREVFFRGAGSLPIRTVIDSLRHDAVDVEVLIGARARGATIPDDLIVSRLDTGQRAHWAGYAALGKRETEWVLTHFPWRVVEIAQAALHYLPAMALPLLLKEAIDDQRALHANPDAPLRLIGDWVASAVPGTGEFVKRRALLLRVVREWIDAGNDLVTGLRALEFTMSLKFHRMGPLDVRHSVQLTSGAATLKDVAELEALWPAIVAIYERSGSTHWEPLYNMIRGWLSPYVGPTVSLSAEYYERTKAQAIGMLSDLLRLAKGDLGVSAWALQWNEDLQLGLDIPIDRGFATLFPPMSRRQDWRVAEQAQRQAVEELAAAWCHEDASSVAERLVAYEKSAASYGRHGPRWSHHLCQLISHSIDVPLRWSQAMIDAHAPGDLITPFLAKAVELRHAGWQDQVVRCIGSPDTVYSMLELVFTLPEPPPALLELALSRVSGWENGVETWCIRGQVSENVTRSLLAHPDRGVAEAAAKGEWHAGPERGVRQSLRDDWRQVVAHCSCDFWLHEVFAKHNDLAFEWLVSNLCELPYFPSRTEENVLRTAIRALDQGMRQMVVDQVPTDLQCLFVLKVLVQDDIALYERLLANDTLVSYHLVPLSGMPDDSWVSRALVALGRYAPEEIARAAYGTVEIGVWSSSMSGRWHEWVQAFGKLACHHDERIREIGRIGRAIAQREYESALANERREAIYGW